MAVTPNIGLNLPANGSINWDVPTNANWNTIDSLLGGVQAAPALVTNKLTLGGDTPFTVAPRMIWGSWQGTSTTIWTYSNPLASIVLDKGITVTRLSVSTGGNTTNCSVSPTISVTDGTNSVTLTFINGSGSFVPLDSGAVSQNFAAGATLRITETAGTCTVSPVINNIAVEYKMQ